VRFEDRYRPQLAPPTGMSTNGISRKLREPRIWKRVLLERLTEPLHLNVLSLFIGLFELFAKNSLRSDSQAGTTLFSILRAAADARKSGLEKLCIVEFGVAPAPVSEHVRNSEASDEGNGGDIKAFLYTARECPRRSTTAITRLYREGDFPMDVGNCKDAYRPTDD